MRFLLLIRLQREIFKLIQKCKFCQSENETLEHLFRDCQSSKTIWFVTMGIRHEAHLTTSLSEWIKSHLLYFWKNNHSTQRRTNQIVNLSIDPGDVHPVTVKFLATMWAMWLHKYDIIFNGCEPNTQRTMSSFE